MNYASPMIYLESIRRDAPAIAELVAKDPERAIASCPGWKAADVMRHIDETFRNTVKNSGGAAEGEGLPAALRALNAIADSIPDPKRLQGLAEEAAIHRWDLEMAWGRHYEIEGELACLSVDGFFNDAAPGMLRWRGVPAGSGQRLHLHRTDGYGEWLVVLGELPIVTHEHAEADATLTGSASDLVLCLWGRIPPPHISGNRSVFDDFHAISKH